MSAIDIIIVCVLAAWAVASIVYIVLRKKKGKCIGCSGCDGRCEKCGGCDNITDNK